jgi:hypothetical protein
LLVGVQENVLHERLAFAMSRGAGGRQLALDVAVLIEEHVRRVVVVPQRVEAEGPLDLVVLPQDAAVMRLDGTMGAPDVWPAKAVAIHVGEVHLARGAEEYDRALTRLRDGLIERAGRRTGGVDAGSAGSPSWVAMALMTSGAWAGTPAHAAATRVAREVRGSRWRPCPSGLVCFGSAFGSASYRSWSGDVWVEAYELPSVEDTTAPFDGAALRAKPPSASTAWIATHTSDGSPLDGDAAGPALLGVETEALHETRRDQYERVGSWGGSVEELRLCLFVEERLWRARRDESRFEDVPGVSRIVEELAAAWGA